MIPVAAFSALAFAPEARAFSLGDLSIGDKLDLVTVVEFTETSYKFQDKNGGFADFGSYGVAQITDASSGGFSDFVGAEARVLSFDIMDTDFSNNPLVEIDVTGVGTLEFFLKTVDANQTVDIGSSIFEVTSFEGTGRFAFAGDTLSAVTAAIGIYPKGSSETGYNMDFLITDPNSAGAAEVPEPTTIAGSALVFSLGYLFKKRKHQQA